ncbi:hypothetical protein ACLB2K_059266 [Fragaria x ananassa]
MVGDAAVVFWGGAAPTQAPAPEGGEQRDVRTLSRVQTSASDHSSQNGKGAESAVEMGAESTGEKARGVRWRDGRGVLFRDGAWSPLARWCAESFDEMAHGVHWRDGHGVCWRDGRGVR